MSIMRFDPFRELETMREVMDRVFEEGMWPTTRRPMEFETVRVLPVNMYETDNDVIVQSAVPGVRPEDINISVSGNMLSIRGERKEETEVKRENFYRHEVRAGQFFREVSLPMPVNADQAEATFENGILTLRLPKAEQVKAKKIEIKGQVQQAGRQIPGSRPGTQH